ncbi:hypothetical protein SO802_014228 [Lithocarpus litseifolius]|uniref:Uncharacterized protein n=1 Tax=Lithocarpus litseifolius TaxID=425828 RepID=A0AAW2CQT3_9ROSI
MGYSHLLSFEASLASFRAAYDVLRDVDIAYCHESDIALHRRSNSNIAFFPLMAILEGGVRFPVDLIIGTLWFYGLCPDQLPPNFYRVVSCSFSQAFLVDSPLLSYIDVRHANFLPPSLTVGEARDLGPRYTTAEDLAPVRDESAERVSQSRKAHIPVEEPDAPVQVAKPVAAVPVHSLEAEANSGEEMKLAEDVEREKALKDMAADTAKEKGKTADATEKRAQVAIKARLFIL